MNLQNPSARNEWIFTWSDPKKIQTGRPWGARATKQNWIGHLVGHAIQRVSKWSRGFLGRSGFTVRVMNDDIDLLSAIKKSLHIIVIRKDFS
jgi:hypothetical protein